MSSNPRTRTWQGVATTTAVLLCAGILFDLVRAFERAPAPVGPPKAPPADVADPSSAAYRPEGADWSAYIAQQPLSVGRKAPVLKLSDHRGRKVLTPTANEPAVWTVLCGCRDCAMTGSRLLHLRARLQNRLQWVAFVSNRSNYLFDRMTSSFGGQGHFIDDKQGVHYRRLRPPGQGYSRLPMVWAIDRTGAIQMVARPNHTDEEWVKQLIHRLDLKVSDEL